MVGFDDMEGTTLGRALVGRGEGLKFGCTVVGGSVLSTHTCAGILMVNGHQEGGLLRGCVLTVVDDWFKLEACGFFGRHWYAHRATSDSQHEVDLLWRDGVGGADEVAFIFTIFVVHDDDHLAVSKCFQSGVD